MTNVRRSPAREFRRVAAVATVAAVGLSPAASDGAAPQCALRESPPITVSKHGQVIELLRIRADGRPAIRIRGYKNVVIRNVLIEHRGGPGIFFERAANLRIEKVAIVNMSEATKGRAARPSQINISGRYSANVAILHVRLTGGSSGVYLLRSPTATLRFIEGYDMRGPFPRGQLVQFDKSDGCRLEDFSAISRHGRSWVEDNVSVYRSSGCVIRRGFLDGNNSPSGVGIMVEQDRRRARGVLVEDVDAVRQGNGCFSAYPGFDVTFRRTRCRDNICADQGRGKPLSGGLAWAGRPGSRGLKIEQSTYHRLCAPDNVVWDRTVFETIELSEAPFTPRRAIRNRFCWEPD